MCLDKKDLYLKLQKVLHINAWKRALVLNHITPSHQVQANII